MRHRRSEYYAGTFSRISGGSRRGRGLRRTRTRAVMSAEALKHVEPLSVTIGPRGSCTASERQASEYCRQVLRDLGYEAHLEEFRAPRSGWAPFSIASGLVLLGIAAFWLLPRDAGALLAATVTVLVTASLLLHLAFRPHPLPPPPPARGGGRASRRGHRPRGHTPHADRDVLAPGLPPLRRADDGRRGGDDRAVPPVRPGGASTRP